MLDPLLIEKLHSVPQKWLVTGGGGFIGSHLVSHLLALGQNVVVLDDFSTGKRKNIPNGAEIFAGDIRDPSLCDRACKNVDIVLHHAAIGSVPKSIEDPGYVDSINVMGTNNILQSAIANGVKTIVFASSSAVYGDSGKDICMEGQQLYPKSPYADGKLACEKFLQEANTAGKIATVSLRYFNVYGVRQDPNGAYAAVVPRWIDAATQGHLIEIYGDGNTIRDFCYIDDVVQANIRAALANPHIAGGNVYNVASGTPVRLNDLFGLIKCLTKYGSDPVYKPFRGGDIRVSCASIEKAMKDLDYHPRTELGEGLSTVVEWFVRQG